MTAAALRIEEVRKHFGDTAALKGVTFEVRPREVVGLVGETYFTIGRRGRRRRTRAAIRWVKSGASIRMSTSGGEAAIAATVSRSRRRMVGSLARTAPIPMVIRSPIGKRLVRPDSLMRGPPTPRNDTGPSSISASACIRPAPRRSLEVSLATRNTSS